MQVKRKLLFYKKKKLNNFDVIKKFLRNEKKKYTVSVVVAVDDETLMEFITLDAADSRVEYWDRRLFFSLFFFFG